MTVAVDSFSPHTPTSAVALRVASVVTAMRYHYNLSDWEIGVLRDRGVAVGFIAEYDTLTWHPILAGADAGTRQGIDAAAKAIARGFPRGSVLWATSDTGVPPARYAQTVPYMEAFAGKVRAAGYRAGIYGGEGLCDYLLDRGLVDIGGWGTGATSWNFGHRSNRVVLRQGLGYVTFGGVQCDWNNVLGPHGAWLPGDAPPDPDTNTPDPPAPPPQEELTVAEIQQILDRIDNLALQTLAVSLGTGSPRTPYKTSNDDTVFYVDVDATARPVRVRIPDPPMLDGLQAIGFVDPILRVLNVDDPSKSSYETDLAHAGALGKIPVVEFNLIT